MAIEDAPKINNSREFKEGIGFKVLYAEDDVYLNEATKMWLERWGHEVIAVESGEELLSKLDNHKFDIIVTDNNMSGITGLEILKKLRGERNDLPVIVLTADKIKEQVENLGGVFLGKNTPIKNLQVVLKEVMEKNKEAQ